MKRQTFAARMDAVSEHMTAGKVLDVGCATGFFLEIAQERGWDVYGVELSTYAARLSQKKFGKNIFNGTLEAACFADNEFDLIALSDLLEHIPEPLAFLQEVRRILKPGGMAMIVTPNVASLSERLMRGKWSHYKTEHLYYLSPRTIGRFLERSDLAPIGIETAPKYLNLDYIISQFTNYPHPLLTPFLKMLGYILPSSLRKWNVPVLCGEMLILARKEVTLRREKG
jgi:SAM-dependent methyltransferase